MPADVALIGYTDRLSARQGERISLMVSSRAAQYTVGVVRLDGVRLVGTAVQVATTAVASAIDGTYDGADWPVPKGSYMRVDSSAALRDLRSFTIACWFMPTLPGAGRQVLVARRDGERGAGVVCEIDDTGRVAVRASDGLNEVALTAGAPVAAWTWRFLTLAYDHDSRSLSLQHEPAGRRPRGVAGDAGAAAVASLELGPLHGPLSLGALLDPAATGGARDHYTGRIDRPAVFARELGDDERAALRDGTPAGDLDPAGWWDLAADQADPRVIDRADRCGPALLVNAPTRAVTGANWTGVEVDFRRVPQQYGAVHFHADDLDDCGWPVACTLEVPRDLASGVYAFDLNAGETRDLVPFAVRPAREARHAAAALLLPTLSYRAYAGEIADYYHPESDLGPYLMLARAHLDARELWARDLDEARAYLQPIDRYANRERLLSLYNIHLDGTGVCYVSSRRPLVRFRPEAMLPWAKSAFNLGADLHLVEWLSRIGADVDVITDDDLHAEGHEALAPYRVVISGNHPEYASRRMLEALEDYLCDGGRFMYLGGNGYYWVTSIDEARPHIAEVRRGYLGSGMWVSEPGEEHHSTTGERGGLWRHRGWTPQRWLGVGSASVGVGSLGYELGVDRSTLPARRILEGVDESPLGGYGAIMGGAAGLEIDRADARLGTPSDATVLGSARRFSAAYEAMPEEVHGGQLDTAGSGNPNIRADLVYVPYPAGGGVFSVGSMAWVASLLQDDGANGVARVTENVLRWFLEPGES